MSQETQRHEITKKRVVYKMPAEQVVIIRRDVEYRVIEAGALTMDIYHPPDSKTEARIPAVVFVNGYPDPGSQKMIGCKQKEMESYISWGKLTAASGLAAITYTTGKEPASDIHALLQHIRENAAGLGIDENRIGLSIEIVDEALGLDNIEWSKGQIAIRRSRNFPGEIPPEPHLDGFASGLNGLEVGKIYSHTALVGVYLTPTLRPFAGNFTVWPGSHYVYESYFRARGPRAMGEPMPAPEIGQPVQLMCGVGDVVIFHYQLGHSAAVNTTEIDRIAVYFRIWLRDIEDRRWEYLTNIWEGWKT